MRANIATRETPANYCFRGSSGRTSLTEKGIVLGGALLVNMGNNGLRIDGEEERILTLFSIARGRAVSPHILGHLRRVSKRWQSGDKCLAAIHLAQSGLAQVDAEGAYRLSLAARLLDAGVTPRELARELGLSPVQLDVNKYDENQPRVPAGNGRESGEWTSSDEGAGGGNGSLLEGRSAGPSTPAISRDFRLPQGAIVVTAPDGTTIDDPDSPSGKLMAPPRANFQEVYAAGEKIASWPILQQLDEAKAALQQFGTYDFQRDKATNTWFSEYVHAANYAVGVLMAGAGYG